VPNPENRPEVTTLPELPERLTGALAQRYRLERELGAGGMATVYLAEDLRHRRQVAVKVLRPELAAAIGPERFDREITTTANLRHPHILPLYDSGAADGFLFYVMPFIEGETLRDRIDREGQLPLEEALRLAREIGDALACAHEQGVIHRDVKPENVLLERGRAVVADFGIARAVSEAGDERLTQTGMSLGTPAYMSPEQASGDPVDARADLYSLGCVVYEMLAGSPPFSGPTALVLMARHAMDPVPPLRTARPGVPERVAASIERALAKAPADRFGSVTAWLEAIEATPESAGPASSGPTGSPGTPASAASDSGERRAQDGAPWIAVMPLKCQTADPDLQSFAEGLAEDLTSSLARFSYLLVISRNSTKALEHRAADVREIAGELGARFVLEGSVRKGGSKIRISLQVVDALTGTHLWADTTDRNLSDTDIFEVQDEITDRAVSTIADPYGVLIRTMAAPTASKPPETLTPYESVLRFFLYQQGVQPSDHLAARTALERAVEVKPGYADAWAGLAICLLDEFRHSFNSRPDPLDRALDAAQRGVGADPTSQLAHFALAQVHHFRGDPGAFRAAAERAIRLNPRDGNTMAFMGILMGYGGDWERGIELTTRAMALNPHHPGWYHFTTFFDAYRKERYAEALEIVQKVNLPEYFPTHYTSAIAHARLGNMAAAQAARARTLELWPDFERDYLSKHLRRWIPDQPELTAHLLEGLRLAGFRIEGGEAD
jgi:eukaryotic-like serine/threonine-protein kinase